MNRFAVHRPGRRSRLEARLQIALAAASLAVLAGCATPISPEDDAEFQSYASAADRPALRPVRSITSFTGSLQCMDRMMRDAGTPTTLISSTFFPDYSGRVPVNTKDMVITALSQMSRLSNAFRYVDFEVDIARQDTVQNLTTILLNTNQMQLQRPALYVSGGISFVDQGILSANHSAGVSGPRVEAGYSRNRGATVVGLDMHLGDFRTRTFIPGMDSANEVVIGTSGQGLDLAGRIGVYGLQFNIGRNLAQGTGAAVRALAELATIELAGKYTKLPYWRCLMQDDTTPAFQRQLREWYEAENPAARVNLIDRYLVSQGYLPPAAQPRAVNNTTLRDALARFQADNGMVVSGTADFTTYARVMHDFVGQDENGELTRIGWPAAGTTPEHKPLAVNMKIENPVRDRTTFAPGTQIFATATVSRAAYLFCYLRDASRNVVRIQPNMANPSALVSANEALRLPDWMVPYPAYLLEAGRQGDEAVMCIATDEDPTARLPLALLAPSLTPLKGYDDLEQVKTAFAEAQAGREMATGMIRWNIATPNGKGAASSADAKQEAAPAHEVAANAVHPVSVAK